MNKKTIILLAPKRTGTTAIFNVFKKHSQVKIAHHDQTIDNWEPQFWNLALKAINGEKKIFKDRLKKTFPDIKVSNNLNKEKIFKMWDEILKLYGPYIFDKSPQYLNDFKVLKLIHSYNKSRKNVKIFCMIRDPRDAITSQFELWNEYTMEDNLLKREKNWLKYFQNIEKFKKIFFFPIFKYEDIALNKNKYFKKIFKHCKLKFEKDSFSQFKPVSLNRYNMVLHPKIKNWKLSVKMQKHLKKYGYKKVNFKISYMEKIFFLIKNFKRVIPLKYKNFLKGSFNE